MRKDKIVSYTIDHEYMVGNVPMMYVDFRNDDGRVIYTSSMMMKCQLATLVALLGLYEYLV